MYYQLNKMSGPNGLVYGCEWQLDSFDGFINRWLIKHNKEILCDPNVPRIAIDIGCGTGRRASNLARLGIFDQIIASDIGDRSRKVKARNRFRTISKLVTGKVAAPIEFLQANVLDIEPKRFEGSQVTFINCRNVLHFLAPSDIRDALTSIRNLISTETLVAISFDHARSDSPAELVLALNDECDGTDFYDRERLRKIEKAKHSMPYAKYDAEDIKSCMRSLGFEIETPEITDCRPTECRIIARAAHFPTF